MTTTSTSLTPVLSQFTHIIPSFTLECGRTLHQVPVAYKTWGTLNETKDNVMVICHAFTGSADVEDWWGPLLGRGKAFDPTRFFIFCANVLGSPYGTASPITINPDTGRVYGPDFPPTTIRDDVKLHKQVLDALGITSVATVIGGSMGGMAVLEWPLCTPVGYIRTIVPLATSARHSAWCISWGEAQRQSIFSDPAYADGWYTGQPRAGLAAARMTALLTYRSRDSFEKRFGRREQLTPRGGVLMTPPDSPRAAAADAEKKSFVFSAQSYLRYQGDKFTARFDANCYVHITHKLDTHDVARGRGGVQSGDDGDAALARVLATLPAAQVISIETDGLFTMSEQRLIAAHIPGAELVVIPSPDGHDGFLLEFEAINRCVLGFLWRVLPEIYAGEAREDPGGEESFAVVRESVFGEAEVARW